MNSHSEYNLRQYRQIAFALQDFEQDKISLNELSIRLEALIDSLTEIDRELEERLLSEWEIIEEVNAVSIYKEKTTLDSHDKQLISTAFHGLKNLIAEVLKTHLPDTM